MWYLIVFTIGFAVGSVCGYWQAMIDAAKHIAKFIIAGKLKVKNKIYRIEEIDD